MARPVCKTVCAIQPDSLLQRIRQLTTIEGVMPQGYRM